MTTLDIDAVKTFVTIAEFRSFTRAAEALGTTQGAISVKLKRLERQVGHRLIERTPRLVRLLAQGAGRFCFVVVFFWVARGTFLAYLDHFTIC